MQNNLKRRPKKGKLLRIGSLYFYYPRESTRIDELRIGESVVITKKAVGDKIQTIEVAKTSKYNYEIKVEKERNVRYYNPNDEKRFNVFVSDLTI